MTGPVRIGEVVAGKYEIQRFLAAGSMGVVVEAHHLHLGRSVALKFMLTHADDAPLPPKAVQRFKREARAAARLRGENIAQVLDVGALDNGVPYIVMEFLDGGDLRGFIESRGRISVSEAVGLVLQACLAMAEAHSRGILHRDLKPENLFLTRRPDGSPLIKVLDFGISKLFEGDAETQQGPVQTQVSQVMGSPWYMSPEQVKSTRDVDVRADIWSLGVILYELTSGEMPYEHRGSTMELLARVLSEDPKPLADTPPDLPADLCRIVDRCLAKDLNKRWQNIAELALALKPLAKKRHHPAIASICAMLGVPAGDTSAVSTADDVKLKPHSLEELASAGNSATLPLEQFAAFDNIDERSLVMLDDSHPAPPSGQLRDAHTAALEHADHQALASALDHNPPDRRELASAVTAPSIPTRLPVQAPRAQPNEPNLEPPSPQRGASGPHGATPLALSDPDAPPMSLELDLEPAPTPPTRRPSQADRASSQAGRASSQAGRASSQAGRASSQAGRASSQAERKPTGSTVETRSDEIAASIRTRRLVYAIATGVLGVVTALLATGVGLLDPFNLAIYKIGFIATRTSGETIHMISGTLLLLVLPLVVLFFTSWFFHRFVTLVCVWWLGQNLLFMSGSVAEAGQILAPNAVDATASSASVASWVYILPHWQIVDVADNIAMGLHWGGLAVMVGALGYMAMRVYRPYETYV